MCPITVIIYVSFEDILVSFSLQRLNFILDHFAWFGLVIVLLMVFLKNALMCMKKVKLITHHRLPISMLLYVMLYIMFAFLMLFAALSNAVCLYNASFFCY